MTMTARHNEPNMSNWKALANFAIFTGSTNTRPTMTITVRTTERVGTPRFPTLLKMPGRRLSRLMARGYREALRMPALATELNASRAATDRIVAPTDPYAPAIDSAAVATGVRSGSPPRPGSAARRPAPTTPTMTMSPRI